MKISESEPIVNIAAELPAARALFETLGIDYCCSGPRSIADAAHAEGLDPETVMAGLRRIAGDKTETWGEKPLRDLIEHLIHEHHHFVRDEMMSLALWLSDLCGPPEKPNPDLQSLRSAFARLTDTILPHLKDEEVLFTHIEALEAAWQSKEPPQGDGDIGARVQHLMTEHATISARLRTIREVRLKLLAAVDQPPRTQRALDAVADLEAHLHEYMFLENCILFPRAIALEHNMVAA